MITTSLSEISHLSVAERIQLAEDIWDSIAAHPEEVSLSEAQTDELEQRLSAYHQNPHEGASWQEVQQRIRGQQ